MTIELETDQEKSVFTKVLNCIRIRNIPLINFCIIWILGSFLLKLTTKYTELYIKNSLITIIVTNLVLFGISETLAQTLICYKPNEPFVTLRVNVRSPELSLTADEEPDLRNEQDINEFIDYIEREENDMGIRPFVVDDDVPMAELTFFQFDRLAGFMIWGFVMAFCQCLWYKFLQIYSTDPKFIEVLRKVLTDQLCYSPLSLLAFFTYGTMVLEKGSWEDTKDKLSRIYLKTLLINYSVWFPVQFINFLLVPRDFQVPFSSSISVLWNCFLSMRNSSS
ncbi:vacuolar membrane protein [[Candida] jaroonii]|uniref:Vacuolar membrane protein n=1 Tax=[Candida] jaroonii TaxID=467808 RepID=A0ACA9Y1R9_9ASCO|nr:vacuolar membrane protein [[Candida] jaroonii]